MTIYNLKQNVLQGGEQNYFNEWFNQGFNEVQQDLINVATSNTSIWGRHAWTFIHVMAAHYPENPTNEDKHWCSQFLKSLAFLLPCVHCRKHYKDYIHKHSQEMETSTENRELFVEFLINLHNNINERLVKPVMPLNVAKQLYTTAPIFVTYSNQPVKSMDLHKKYSHDQNIRKFWIWITVLLLVVSLTIGLCVLFNTKQLSLLRTSLLQPVNK